MKQTVEFQALQLYGLKPGQPEISSYILFRRRAGEGRYRGCADEPGQCERNCDFAVNDV